jgi:hypothetical protein
MATKEKNKEVQEQKRIVSGNIQNLENAIAEILSRKDKNLDLLKQIKDDEWKKVLQCLQEIDMEATTAQTQSMMRSAMGVAIRKLCGKEDSKQPIHNILVKAVKTHASLPVFAHKVIHCIHPHFCVSLDDFIEIEQLSQSKKICDGLSSQKHNEIKEMSFTSSNN